MEFRHLTTLTFVLLLLLVPIGSAVATPAEPTPTDSTIQPQVSTQSPSSTETIGYWKGVWYNDTFEFDGTNDYLDAENRSKLVKRTIARVEVLRNDTFEEEPPLNIIPREQYQRNSAGYTVREGEAAEWNNLVWQALFIVEDDTNVEKEIQSLYGGQVRAFYSPSQETMYVIVAQSQTDLVKFDSTSVAHELVHAYQHQRFDLGSNKFMRDTQDGGLAKNSLLEGEAMYIETQYQERCSTGEWSCYQPTDGESTTSQANLNLGIQLTAYFPYSDGHSYIEHQVQTEGWNRVNQTYSNIPESSTQIIHYTEDREYATATIPDNSTVSWRTYDMGVDGTERNGEATLFVMLWYQNYEYSIDTGVSESHISKSNDVSRYNYSHSITDGLVGDAVTPYYHRTENKTGYVFNTEWETKQDRQEFVNAYELMLEGHGGELKNTSMNGDVYVLEDDSGYSGVYYLERDGTRFTITYAESLKSIRQIRGLTETGESVTDTKPAWQQHLESIPPVTIAVIILSLLVVLSYAIKIAVTKRFENI